jgi:aspartyl-tRNA synthetase
VSKFCKEDSHALQAEGKVELSPVLLVNNVKTCSVTKESIIDIEAAVHKVSSKIESCSQKDVELHVTQLFTVSSAKSQLPLLIEDAARPVKEDEVRTFWMRGK